MVMGRRFLTIAVSLFATSPVSGQFYTIALTDAVGFTGDSVAVVATLDHEGASFMQGWAWGVCHDPDDLELIDVVPGATLVLFPPDLISSIEIHPAGWTVGAVYELGAGSLPPGLDYEMYVADYEIIATEPALETPVEFCSTLGCPPIGIAVVISGLSITPEQVDAAVLINPTDLFRRGDGNDDSAFDIADAVYVLEHLFYAGPPLVCADSGDANDDGALDIADPVYILEALFGGGPGIPAPGWEVCGRDPTTDALGCASEHCP